MADEFESRERQDGVRQRFVRIKPVEFEGASKLEHREGGAYPLYVKEGLSGVYVSSWMIDTIKARKFMKELRKNSRRGVVLSLVVDTNVSGHPSLSMQLQEIFLVEG